MKETLLPLEHGQFLPWIQSEFEMSRETADNLMSVYSKFGDQIGKFYQFKPSILYALAAPSIPEPVIEHAIEKAESGAISIHVPPAQVLQP